MYAKVLPDGRLLPVGAESDDDDGFNVRELANGPNVATVASVAMGYHGYKRTGSIVWALIWAGAGRTFPLFTVPIAVAMGFGKKKECK